MELTELEPLQKAIHDEHGCNGAHVASISVQQSGWEGVVEVFALDEHATAKYAYAWSRKDAAPVVILGVSPINSAYAAVHAYLRG